MGEGSQQQLQERWWWNVRSPRGVYVLATVATSRVGAYRRYREWSRGQGERPRLLVWPVRGKLFSSGIVSPEQHAAYDKMVRGYFDA